MVVELIAKDKNEKYQFQGRCKLKIDSVSKLLLIEPFIEEFKMISALFKWQFVAQKNILFVFAEQDFQDCALIFDDKILCDKTVEFLIEKGATSGNKDLIKKQFLIPLFKEISKNDEMAFKLKEIILKWIQQQNVGEKEKLIQILKKNNVYDLFYQKSGKNRKRKAADICYPKIKKRKIEIIKKPNYEIIHYQRNGEERSRLFIFPSTDRTFCYEYRYENLKQKFYCCTCMYFKKYLSAKICEIAGSEDDIVQLNGNNHVCEMKKYNPEKYLVKEEIIKSPNFRQFSYFQKGIQRKKLVVFDSTNCNLCYEYYWSEKERCYYCCGCVSNEQKKSVVAKISRNEKTGEDYVILKTTKHVCDLREFNAAKFDGDKIICKPGFELFEGSINGKMMKQLFIFVDEERKLCYKYFHGNRKGKSYYSCSKCYSANYSVNASIQKDESGNEMVVLRTKNPHICEPIEYIHPSLGQLRTVSLPGFQLVKRKANGKIIQRLALFDSKDKSLCYEYTKGTKQNIFKCGPCSKYFKISVYVRLKINEESGEEYIILGQTEHKCKLRKFIPEDLIGNILKKPDFKIDEYLVKGTKKQIRIIVYDKKKKGNFYCFTWKRNNTYICNPCKTLGKFTSVKLCENESDGNYLEIKDDHICKSRNKL